MRRVTIKPPTILIVAFWTDIAARMPTKLFGDPSCSNAPMMMMPEIAFVTAISGVCSAWLTFQITWKPTKQDRAKTIKCYMKLAGA